MKGKRGTKSGGTRERVRNDLSVQIGKAAREARRKLGLTQEDIAERVGITTEVYGRLERGDMLPSTPTLIKLRTALGVTSDYLVGLAADEIETPPQSAKPASGVELTPDYRRLRRTLRTMDSIQLSTFWRMADALATFNRKRRVAQHKAQEATT